MEVYGTIENIDMFEKTNNQSFAFIKFHKVEMAQKAFESQSMIRLMLNNSNLKLSYSDHQRRPDIVGDCFGYENKEDCANVLYISYSLGHKLPLESELVKELEKYESVKQTRVNEPTAQSASYHRPFILAEFGSLDAIRRVYKKYDEDNGARKYRLGDKNCVLSILVKNKDQKLTQNVSSNIQFPVVNQQIQHPPLYQQQQKIASNLMQQQMNGSNEQINNLNNNYDVLKNLEDILQSEMTQQEKKEEEKEIDTQKEQVKFPHVDSFWSGFITKQKQNRVGVDATLLYGDEIQIREYNIDISHKTTIEDMKSKIPKCIALITPENETQFKQFNIYKNYLQSKKRVGVCNLQKYKLMLVPPCSEIQQLYPLEENEMLGVFVDSNADSKQQGQKVSELGNLKEQFLKKHQSENETQVQPKKNNKRLESEEDDIMKIIDDDMQEFLDKNF